eukprot:1399832-Rhodomonas_salina.2
MHPFLTVRALSSQTVFTWDHDLLAVKSGHVAPTATLEHPQISQNAHSSRRGVCIMPMTATATRHAIDTHMASLADTTLLEARRVARSE